MGIVISLLSMTSYIVETSLQVNDAATSEDLWRSVLVATIIVAGFVVTNILSAVLVSRTMDFSGKSCGRFICILMHCGQIGLLWRYLKLFMLYDEHDWKEFVFLRTIQTMIQTIPYILLKGNTMLYMADFSAISVTAFCVSIISSGFVFTMFNLGNLLFESDEFLDRDRRIKKPCGTFSLVMGTIFMLSSRCGAIVVMSSVLTFWISIPIGLHFITLILILSIKAKCNNQCSVFEIMKVLGLSLLCTFDAIVQKFKVIHCTEVLYYSAILVENIIMVATWVLLSSQSYVFKLFSVVVILCNFVFGVILKSCSCGYIEENEDDNFSSSDVFDFEQTTLKIESSNKYSKKRKTGDVNHLSSNTASEIKIESIFTPISESMRIQKKLSKSQSSKSSGKGSLAVGESNGDLNSSNSRNTNTLNVSKRSNKQNKSKETDLEQYNERARMSAITIEMKSPKAKQKQSLQVSDTKNTNIASKSPQIKKYSMGKKLDIPLFPQECNNIIGSKEFGSPKPKHILSNSVAEYTMDDSSSDSSYSEYLSYSSYYVDSTDWSSMSCDSDGAMTWPPSNPITLVNIHSLPKEKLETTDSVRVWLSRLDEWEPSYDTTLPDSWDEAGTPDATRSVHSMETEHHNTEIFKRSSSVPEPKHHTNIRNNKSSHSFEGENSHDHSYINHVDIAGEQISVGLPHTSQTIASSCVQDDKETFLVWHDDSLSAPDVVQESVV
ncbi:uncharacterized protein LOC133184743 [Saccostrea echinata]|uniref:uncharacterized protein LOC133184743 n=1 Tax=Saccostrea echinata TaxID=191078 RepID=UPI002A801384|nr:uncharacterized protein LOC133184743 [Saccostrea echinata]